MKREHLLIATLLASVVTTGANAALITYTDQTAFSTAIGSALDSSETFASATPGVILQTGQAFNGFTASWTNGASSSMAVYVTDDSFSGAQFSPFTTSEHLGWAEDSTYFNGSGSNGPTVTLTFDNAQNAISFDWYDTDGSDEYLLAIDGVNVSFPSATSFDGTSFFGVYDASSTFTTLTFTSTSPGGHVEEMGLDNVSFNAGSGGGTVPEPTTLALLGLGLTGLGFSRKKKKA